MPSTASQATTQGVCDHFAYCSAVVRAQDPERYLCSLFAPIDRRPQLHALYAFNLELARCREAVSEPTLGLIRLQWWRDAVEEIYRGAPRQHQVVLALAATITTHELPRALFDRLIDVREQDMAESGPENLDALVAYADATAGTLVEQSLEILGVRDADAAAVGREVGIAWALTGLLRAVPFHARSRRLYLPADLIAASALSLGDLFALRSTPQLARVVAQIAGRARDHLVAARARIATVPRSGRAALLTARLADLHLKRFARARYDPFDPRMAVPLATAPLWLAVAALTGRY